MFHSVISLIPMPTRIIIFVLLLFLIEYYAFQAIKVLTAHMSVNWKRGLRIGFVGLSLSLYGLSLFAMMKNYAQTNRTLFVFIMCALFINIVSRLLIMLPMFIEDIYRVFNYLFQLLFSAKETENKDGVAFVSRKKFISQIGLGLGGLSIAGLSYGIIRGAHNYKVHRKKIAIEGLPESFKGLKIGHLSDIHTGSFWDKEAVKKGIQKLLKEQPDVIFFTGDLVNSLTDELTEDYIEMFSQVKAPMGVYSVLGNHDYGDYFSWHDGTGERPNYEKSHMGPSQRANLEKLIAIQKRMGWDLLLNESRILKRGNDTLTVIGVENIGGGNNNRFPRYGNLDLAMKDSSAQDLKILLSHDPSHWNYEVQEQYKDIRLTLSGHTHGAQFGIETGGFQWSPIKYIYKQWAGLYSNNEQHIYVNRGFGYLGYPGRLGIRPEVGILTLV
jgi:predicted MPP superfamily phosphohydrolase